MPRRSPPDVSVGIEGFLPPSEAAEVMGLSLDELVALVQRGRPAVVSVLGVRQV